jgi:hypothetical protein
MDARSNDATESRFRPAARLAAIGVSEILRIAAKAGALKRAGRRNAAR